MRVIVNDTNNTMDNRMTITRKHKWEEKQLNWRFKWLINNISHGKTWTWQEKLNFKRETEYLLKAAQNNAVRTNHIKVRIDDATKYKYRLCGDRDETINHIINECSKLALKQYKTRPDWVGKLICREMCKELKCDYMSTFAHRIHVIIQQILLRTLKSLPGVMGNELDCKFDFKSLSHVHTWNITIEKDINVYTHPVWAGYMVLLLFFYMGGLALNN